MRESFLSTFLSITPKPKIKISTQLSQNEQFYHIYLHEISIAIKNDILNVPAQSDTQPTNDSRITAKNRSKSTLDKSSVNLQNLSPNHPKSLTNLSFKISQKLLPKNQGW